MHTLKVVLKFKPEKNSGLNGIRTHCLCDTGAVLNQMSYEAVVSSLYSYFKKRCQKKSKHPISQDPKVVWVVSNRSLLLQLKGSSRSHDDDAEDND